MPIAKSMGCSMDDAGCTEVYRPRGLTIGTSKVGAALKKNASVPWRPMPTLISWSNWQLVLE